MENSSLLNHSELSYQIYGFILEKETEDNIAEYKISPSFRGQVALLS